MQNFNFALRQSTADSVDDNRSRYVPSSIYSGPGPAEESPLPVQSMYVQNGNNVSTRSNGVRSTYQSTGSNSYTNVAQHTHSRNSAPFKPKDPVLMHLLAETALSDSKDFEILSFEELEQLKRDRLVLRNRVDATRKKIALECKLRDAAQSLDRLYTKSKGSMDLREADNRGHSRNGQGSKSSNNEALRRANDEYLASSQRIENLTRELKSMEARLENAQRRVLEHTAGILQLTHKGLKKNLKKNELPRSPESMTSPGRRRTTRQDQMDDFDERSLYPIPDYVQDFVQSNPVTPIMPASRKPDQSAKTLDEVAARLQATNLQIRDLAQQLSSTDANVASLEIPVPGQAENSAAQIDMQFSQVSRSLELLATTQQQVTNDLRSIGDRIVLIVEMMNTGMNSPMIGIEESMGKDLGAQLAHSTRTLDQIHAQVGTLVEQKDILTRQIQQQRELNSKSDAQRDAQIQDLTEELQESQRLRTMADQEAQESQNQISMLIDQLDRTKQDAMLMEQQHGMNENNALQAERDARKAAEATLIKDIEAKQEINMQLQADMAKAHADFELRSQQHIKQMNELTSAKEEASLEATRYQSEAEKVLEQMAALQTELTIVKAELDGAYGTRAERAADVSLNPAIQRELDSLNTRNGQLQKELKDTIEDYEHMTKASLEFEKERDQFESTIDTLRERCESVESQLSEEKLKWLGIKAQLPAENTSTVVLKNEFKKMMRDTRAENVKALRAEQEERKKLETIIRNLRKDAGTATPVKAKTGSQLSAEPMTPSLS